MSASRIQMVCDCRYPAVCNIRYHLTAKAKADAYNDLKDENAKLKSQRDALLMIVRTLARFIARLRPRHRRAA